MGVLDNFLRVKEKTTWLRAVLMVRVLFGECDTVGPFTCTCLISRNQAIVARVPEIGSVNQCAWIERQNRRALYRVVWIGHRGLLEGMAGLELVDGKIIWEPHIQRTLV